MFFTNPKHLTLSLIVSVAGVGTLSALSVEKIQAQTPPVNGVTPQAAQVVPKAKVKFKKPLPVENVVKFKNRRNVKLEQLDSELVVGGKPIYGIYNFDSNPSNPSTSTKTATELASYITKERLAYFADIVAGEGDLSAEERIELKPQLDAMKVALQTRNFGPILVSEIMVSGQQLNLQQLNQDIEVEKVEVEDRKLTKQVRQSVKNFIENDSPQTAGNYSKVSRLLASYNPASLVASLNPALLFAQTTSRTWFPNSGRSETGQSANAPNERYTKQYMRWNANLFTANQTYEHEFYLDATDGNRTYITTAQTAYPNCMPRVTSTQSTWGAAARPYLDTRLEQVNQGFCEAGRIGYVLGAAQASAIAPGVTHHTYIRAANGNANSDRFQLRAQRGFRFPANCFTTWCSSGDRRVFLVGGGVGGIEWSVNVPGVKNWVR